MKFGVSTVMSKVVVLIIGMAWIFAGVKEFGDHGNFFAALEFTVGGVFLYIGLGGK